MLESNYIEDIFLELSNLVYLNSISYQPQDYKPVMSFRTILKNGDQLTDKQGKFILILIGKYKKQLEQHVAKKINVDELEWRQTFRVIDYSKSLSIHNNDQGYPCAFLKFPYTLKEPFDKAFGGAYPYNPETKTREVPILDVNPIELLDFCRENGFSIDPVFLDYVENVEEVWDIQDDIMPHSDIINGEVVLINSIESTQEYFNNRKFNNIDKDLFLARTLGFPFLNSDHDPINKLCSNIDDTHFWTPNMDTLADILVRLELDNVVVVLDRQSDFIGFISNMIDSLERRCYNTTTIRVCFRGANDNEAGKEFNKWIKMNNLGGKIESGNIFVFKHTIAKWAKNIKKSPQLVISNFIYESTNVSTRNFLKSCHATITVSETKPTTRKDNQIAKL